MPEYLMARLICDYYGSRIIYRNDFREATGCAEKTIVRVTPLDALFNRVFDEIVAEQIR